jgi:hypothetical protein
MFSEKYGYVYVWYDKKYKRFYLGRHWGTESDGYICSSTNMRNNYKNRPNDFKRRIVSKIYTCVEDLVKEEQKWLDMIKSEELDGKYYNKTKSATTPSTRGYAHSPETIEKIRSSNIGKIVSEETKQKLRESNKKQFENLEQRELRRKKTLELWEDPEYRKNNTLNKVGKKQFKEQIEKRINSCKNRWKINPKRGRAKTEEEKQKIRNTLSNLIWINNGYVNTRIHKEDVIIEGFVKGRVKRLDIISYQTKKETKL